MISPADIRRYASDPMIFFADTLIPGPADDMRLVDCWADFQREAFQVLADCMTAVAVGRKPPYRGIWLERTKGASKDSDVGLALLWLLMFSRRPQLVELGADDQDQILETAKAMVSIIRSNPWIGDRIEVQRSKILCEATASECDFLTRDASGSHGSRPSVTVCNELAHCSDANFIFTMADNSDKVPTNLMILATNAGELRTWQHKWRENYRVDPSWWFQKVDSIAPWIDVTKVADAERRNPPGRFKRLWRGIWTSPGGDALPPAAIERCIVHEGPLHERGPEWTLAGVGVDAGVRNHHAAIAVVVGSDRTQKLRVAKVVDFPPPCRLEVLKDAIIREAKRFNTPAIFVDPWQMILLAEQLTSAGFSVEHCTPTANTLKKQSATLLEVIRDGVLELYNHPLLVEDLYSCRIVEKTYGARLELAENENGHSDRLAALANALPACLESLGHIGAAPVVPDGPTNSYGIPFEWCDELGNQTYWP